MATDNKTNKDSSQPKKDNSQSQVRQSDISKKQDGGKIEQRNYSGGKTVVNEGTGPGSPKTKKE